MGEKINGRFLSRDACSLSSTALTSLVSRRPSTLSSSRLSLFISGSQSIFTHLKIKTKKESSSSHFSVYCSSLEAAKQSSEETPIELSTEI